MTKREIEVRDFVVAKLNLSEFCETLKIKNNSFILKEYEDSFYYQNKLDYSLYSYEYNKDGIRVTIGKSSILYSWGSFYSWRKWFYCSILVAI